MKHLPSDRECGILTIGVYREWNPDLLRWRGELLPYTNQSMDGFVFGLLSLEVKFIPYKKQ